MYIRWVLMLPLVVLSSVLGRVLAPLVVLFANKEGWLPKWLWWFQTPDNPLDGDAGHLARWPRQGRFWTYIRRVAWLLRNVMYGFDFSVLGFRYLRGDDYRVEGDPQVGNRPLHEGVVKRFVRRDGRDVAFQLYYVNAWTSKWCVRVNLGWKLWNYPTGEQFAQYVCTFSFTMGYSRKVQ